MEKKLKVLFDFQKFEKNERLDKLISQSENRFGKELTDDDLSYVNAAGVADHGVDDPFGKDDPETERKTDRPIG